MTALYTKGVSYWWYSSASRLLPDFDSKMLLHKRICYSRPLHTRKWFHADNIHRPAACYPTYSRKFCYIRGSIPHDRFSTESDCYYRPAIKIPIACRLVKCRTKFIHVNFKVIIYCHGEKICAIEWEAKFWLRWYTEQWDYEFLI